MERIFGPELHTGQQRVHALVRQEVRFRILTAAGRIDRTTFARRTPFETVAPTANGLRAGQRRTSQSRGEVGSEHSQHVAHRVRAEFAVCLVRVHRQVEVHQQVLMLWLSHDERQSPMQRPRMFLLLKLEQRVCSIVLMFSVI